LAIIDSISEVQQILIEPDTHTVQFDLAGVPVDNRYPQATILIDQTVCWQGTVTEKTQLEFKNLQVNSACIDIQLHYTNKSNQDTKVIDGKIVANQCIQIMCVEIDHVAISGYVLRDHSVTDYDLTDQEKDAYNTHGQEWKNVKTTMLYNNGIWKLNLEKPILSTLLKKRTAVNHVFDTPHQDIMHKLQQYFKESTSCGTPK
jgi:hypothetical protein